jgi:uncharacterized protein YndB with AHSA1/START domain
MNSTKDAPPQADRQVYRVVIEAPIQQVWETLTQTGKPLPFFFGSVLHTTSLAPGAPVRMRTPNGKYTGVVGEVIDFDPPHRYSHTFKFTSLDDPICTVIYELKEIEGGTEFTLITENVPAGTKTADYMASGGELITSTLKALVETGKPPFKTRMILTMIGLTAWMTPKQCRSEHWPLDKAIR